MIRALLLAFLTSLTMTAPGMALDRLLSPEEIQLIKDVSGHNSAIHTMVGRFLQIDSQNGRTEGTFYIERPGKVRFRYAPPSREEIISVGRGFYVIDRRDRTSYAYPQDRVPLRQFLDDKIDFFATNMTDVVTTNDFISITIADDSPIGTVQVSLIFEIATLELRQWTLTEPSGEELTFSVYDVTKNVEIPKSYFYIDPSFKAPDK